jgi:hypothetical protein
VADGRQEATHRWRIGDKRQHIGMKAPPNTGIENTSPPACPMRRRRPVNASEDRRMPGMPGARRVNARRGGALQGYRSQGPLKGKAACTSVQAVRLGLPRGCYPYGKKRKEGGRDAPCDTCFCAERWWNHTHFALDGISGKQAKDDSGGDGAGKGPSS